MNILRINDQIKLEKFDKSSNNKLILTEEEDNPKLGKIDIKDSKYYFTPITKETNVLNESINSISEINNLSWLVYKGQKIPSHKNSYIVKEGDIIKLGREILMIRDIHFKKKKSEKINNNETIKGNNELGLSFHTQTSQSLNLNDDFNFLENKENKENKDNNEDNENNENKENNLVEENYNKTENGNEIENNNNNKTSKDLNENKNNDVASYNSDKNSELIKKNKKICRICYMEETDKKINPLIKPCKCSGSMKYIHYECLLHWLKTKVLVANNSYCNNGFYTIYILNLIECELCKNHLPNYIKHNNKIYSLIDYDKFDKEKKIPKKDKNYNFNDNYIIFDEVTPGKEGNKYRYLVNFDENNIIKIGRGLEMQLILNDISVSRNHCQLKLDEEGNLILEDNNSKFGTLVLIQAKSIEILKGKTLTVQVGTNFLNMKLNTQKNLFGCCNVEEIDERNSYEKINFNSVKFDKKSEILNESLSDNSDGEDNAKKEDELIEKDKNKEMNDMNKLENNEKGNGKKKNENGYINYNMSDLNINNEQKKYISNNVKLIKKRIESMDSKSNNNIVAGANTTIKIDDKNINIKEENPISENKKEESKNYDNKSESDSDDDDSEESSDENSSSDQI